VVEDAVVIDGGVDTGVPAAEEVVVEETPDTEPVVETPVVESASATMVPPPEPVAPQPRLGRAGTFGDALARLDYRPKQYGTMQQPVPPSPIQQMFQPPQVQMSATPTLDANAVAQVVSQVVHEQISQVMEAMQTELDSLRQSMAEALRELDAGTPRRPQRKSLGAPPVQAAQVTTQVQTFADVLDRLNGLRK
jgi:hypothetical protein